MLTANQGLNQAYYVEVQNIKWEKVDLLLLKLVLGGRGPKLYLSPPTPFYPLSEVAPEAAEDRLETGDLGLLHHLTKGA